MKLPICIGSRKLEGEIIVSKGKKEVAKCVTCGEKFLDLEKVWTHECNVENKLTIIDYNTPVTNWFKRLFSKKK